MRPFRNVVLDRRTLLRGAGAALALPWLQAMRAAVPAAPTEPVRRALFVFMPNGVKMDDWKPATEGRAPELPFLLAPFEPVRQQLTVVSGLAIDGGRAHGDGAGDHARATASFLTCAHPKKTGGADIEVGVSVDQVIAEATGAVTRFASLEYGLEKGNLAGVCDSGYSCAYSNNVSWRTKSTPVAKETDPRAMFARLFGDPATIADAAARARDRSRDRSVLDAVLADAAALRGTLGGQDRAKLDDYLTAVRELEQRLERDPGDDPQRPEVPPGLVDRRGTFADRLDVVYEVIALAFAADLSRTATLMLGNGGSNRSYRFLGVPDGHHDLSHHGGDERKLAGVRAINRFQMEHLAAFASRLRATADAEQDLLSRTIVVCGSGLGDGNRHNHDDLPVLVAGGAGLGVAGDRHLVVPDQTPMANLWVAVQRRLGLPAERFADSTGVLEL